MILIALAVWALCGVVGCYIYGRYDPEPWENGKTPSADLIFLTGPLGLAIALYFMGFSKNDRKDDHGQRRGT